MNKIDLHQAFIRRQEILKHELDLPKHFTQHAPTIGSASELKWIEMFKSFLPGRYEVGSVFAMDSKGHQSEQIDLAIYDRQYSPLWFENGDDKFVPVESIYAVFEIKQDFSKEHLKYAADKVASVRGLHRTSAPFAYSGGVHPPIPISSRPILGGLLTLKSGWTGGLSVRAGRDHIESYVLGDRIDMGLALSDVAFEFIPDDNDLKELGYEDSGLIFSKPDSSLIFFMLHLYRRLQSIGTALAADIPAYEAALNRP